VYPEISFLHAEGYRVWYDEGIDPGNEWPVEIARALSGCAYFIVFVSPNAVGSMNVRNEINLALAKKKPFLAVHLVETVLPDGLDLQMGSIQAMMRFRMSDEPFHRKIRTVLPLSLRLSREQELQKQDEERSIEEFVSRHRQAQAENRRRADQEAKIVRILNEVIETGTVASFGAVTIRPGNGPREIDAVLESDIHPFSIRELRGSGWTVEDPRKGARLVVKAGDEGHLRRIAQNIRSANEAP